MRSPRPLLPAALALLVPLASLCADGPGASRRDRAGDPLPDGAVVAMIAAIAAASVAKDSIRAAIAPIRRRPLWPCRSDGQLTRQRTSAEVEGGTFESRFQTT